MPNILHNVTSYLQMTVYIMYILVYDNYIKFLRRHAVLSKWLFISKLRMFLTFNEIFGPRFIL